jgi:hypothetical protein
MQKQDRVAPDANGRSQRSFCSWLKQLLPADACCPRRGEDVHRDGTEQRISGFLEHDRLADMRQTQPAVFDADMRRHQPLGRRQRHQFAAEFLGRAVMV